MTEQQNGRDPIGSGSRPSDQTPSGSDASRFDPSRGGASLLRRLTLCPFGLCQTFRTASDETGIWGECQKCGKRVGYVDRRSLSNIGGREFERHWENSHG